MLLFSSNRQSKSLTLLITLPLSLYIYWKMVKNLSSLQKIKHFQSRSHHQPCDHDYGDLCLMLTAYYNNCIFYQKKCRTKTERHKGSHLKYNEDNAIFCAVRCNYNFITKIFSGTFFSSRCFFSCQAIFFIFTNLIDLCFAHENNFCDSFSWTIHRSYKMIPHPQSSIVI